MSRTLKTSVAVIGVDIGKNSFHLVGQDRRGAIVLRQKWSRGQVEARLANLPPCLNYQKREKFTMLAKKEQLRARWCPPGLR
jgi:hypothetical protein